MPGIFDSLKVRIRLIYFPLAFAFDNIYNMEIISSEFALNALVTAARFKPLWDLHGL